MKIGTNSTVLVYGLLLGGWGIVVGWQAVEHNRVKEAKRTALLKTPSVTAKILGKVIQSIAWDTRSGRLLEQERLETALKGLVTDDEVSSIGLLNAAGEPVVAAGAPIDFETIGKMRTGEHWDSRNVTLVRRVDLVTSQTPEGETNRPPIVVPSPPRRESSSPPRERTKPSDGSSSNSSSARTASSTTADLTNTLRGVSSNFTNESPSRIPSAGMSTTNQTERASGQNQGDSRPRGRRPPFFFMMSEEERKSMAEKKGLHWLVIAMSTESFRQACTQDLWLRWIIGAFAGVSAAGLGFAWRNVEKSSELQMRLVRTSEMNSYLREMNVAAAGLAHETRNPLNIIRGLAQMISKEPDASGETRSKSREITIEVDRVTAQLNEFINYSKPREVRRAPVALNTVVADVVRALKSDIEDKAIHLESVDENLVVEADEQFLRQVLFNLLLNAIQAVDTNGEIQVVTKRTSPVEACLEVRDNGPGVPLEQRKEIFKPYFTTHQKGTGLGLAVVQQIVQAHGWEIECVAKEKRGAVFRVSRMQLASKA